MRASFYGRFGVLICLLALVSFPVLMYGAARALQSNSNNVMDWLPKSFDEYQDLVWFGERFGSDEVLIVSWPGCTLDDERLDDLAARLQQPAPTKNGGEPTPHFRHVFTGRQLLKELTSPKNKFRRSEARERMQGWLLGPDEKTTCAVALISDASLEDRDGAVQWVYDSAEAAGVPREKLRLGGPTVDSVAINEASQTYLIEMGSISALLGAAVSWWCLRRFRLIAAVFITAVFAWAMSLSFVALFTSMDAVLLMMPGLIYVLAVSGAIHMTGYYSEALREGTVEDAPGNAVRIGWLPCALASSTTAIGLGSLAVSQIVPIVKFAVFSAAGVLFSLAALFVLWPSILRVWPARGVAQRELQQTSGPAWWEPFYRVAVSHWALVLLAALPLFPLLGYGVSKVSTTVTLTDMFKEDSKVFRDYAWLEQEIAPLVPVEVLLRFDPPDHSNSQEMFSRAVLVERLRQQIDAMEDVGGTLAIPTFISELPQGKTARQVARRGVAVRRLEEARDDFVKMRYLYGDEHDELWRISARVSAMSGLDYPAFLNQLKAEVNKFLAEDSEAIELQATSRIAGGVPLVCAAQQQLLNDLGISFLTAFLLIAVAMAFLIRSPTAGLISMLPNIFPALILFGVMGWLNVAIDIGTMMTASVAMGIAVDDTSHFLTSYRRGLLRGESRLEAIHTAFRYCATAMLRTSLICSLGLLVFAISPFVPISRFAWLMCGLLFAALIGDLLLLPALLASPFGKWFVPKNTDAGSDALKPVDSGEADDHHGPTEHARVA